MFLLRRRSTWPLIADNFGRIYLSTVRCVVKRNTSSRHRRQLQPSSPCGLRRAKSEKAFYEARLRRMKQSFGLWSTAWQRYETKPFQASCFFCPEFGQKKWGANFCFLYLVLTRENSNLFSANRNNCKTFPLRLFTWIEVLLILFMLCITITLCLRLPVENNKNFYWQHYVNMLYYNGQRNNLWRGATMLKWLFVALLALPFIVSISGEPNAIQRKK